MPQNAIDPRLAQSALVTESGTMEVIAATTKLKAGQTSIEVTLPDAVGDAITITLPPVASCAGAEFWFHATEQSGHTNGIATIEDDGDGFVTDMTDIVFGATDDYAVIKNWCGKVWRKIEEVSADS